MFTLINRKHRIKNKRIIAIIASILVALASQVGVIWADEPNYQVTLINFYAQQLVAHGALLFAATTAAFTFVRAFVPTKSGRNGKEAQHKARLSLPLIFIIISGILFGVVFYAGFRMVCYGFLSSGAISFPTPVSKYENHTLADFVNDVCVYTFRGSSGTAIIPLENNQTYNLEQYERAFLSNFVSGREPMYYSIQFCFYLGFFLTYIIYYAFAEHTLSLKAGVLWAIFFLAPASVGSIVIVGSSIRDNPWSFFGTIWYVLCSLIAFGYYKGGALKRRAEVLMRRLR